MKKILVAVDGSAKSKKAALKASEIAELFKANVTIITVLKDVNSVSIGSQYKTRFPEVTKEYMEEEKKEIHDRALKITEEAAEFFKDKNINLDTVIKYGYPADIICSYSENNSFDLIVMADKGQGQIKRFLLGSTSDRVVRHANTSVLIIK